MRKIVAILLSLVLLTSVGVTQRDEDYHPQGEDTEPSTPPYYEGYINKLEEDSNQLEPQMDTTTYGASGSMVLSDFDSLIAPYVEGEDDVKWHDSIGSQSRADQWALTSDLSYAISNRGVPYEPGQTYYHPDTNVAKRTKPQDSSVEKTVKVFANSVAVEAASTFDGDSGTIYDGDGFWLDPDDLKQYWEAGRLENYWVDSYHYAIDLTGKDSGLGFDLGDGTGITYLSSDHYTMRGDVYFKGEATGGVVGELEKPMCGDDRREYLLEEMGESQNPERFSGQYACSNNRNQCVDMSASGSKLFDTGTMRQTDEPDEEYGRLKNDAEVCQRYDAEDEPHVIKDDVIPNWYDQDYKESLCKDQNTLFGSPGKRWVSNDTVDQFPNAFTGGIDDDWNARLQQLYRAGYVQKNYTTKTYREDWNPGEPYDKLESPVSSGSLNQSVDESNSTIATLGFCAGDDEGEHIVIQRCNSGVCPTDTSVYGVAENPSSCIMDSYNDHDEYGTSSNEYRDLYEPGESVTFSYDGDTKTVSCFQGVWYQEWPIVFNRDAIEVTKGDTASVNFRLINPEKTDTTYDVELMPVTGNLREGWVEFSGKGSEFTTTVPAQSSRTYTVEVYGGSTEVDSSTVTVAAGTGNGDIYGSDDFNVNVVEEQSGQTQETETRDVPGIGAVQLAAIAAITTTIYFLAL